MITPTTDTTEYNQIQHVILDTLGDLLQRGFNKELIAHVISDLILHPEKATDWTYSEERIN